MLAANLMDKNLKNPIHKIIGNSYAGSNSHKHEVVNAIKN